MLRSADLRRGLTDAEVISLIEQTKIAEWFSADEII
jgi:hypothetical protein